MKIKQIKYIQTGQITEHLNKNKPRPEFKPEYSVCMVNVDNMISLELNDFCTKLCGSKMYSLRFGSDITFIVEEESYNKICSIYLAEITPCPFRDPYEDDILFLSIL